MLPVAEKLPVFLPHHRKQIRFHQLRGQAQTHVLRVTRAQIRRESAVDFTPLHGFHSGSRGRIGLRLKIDVRVHDAVGRDLQIVLQCAGQFARLRFRRTEGQIFVLVSDPDRPVPVQPFLFRRGQERVRSADHQVLVKQFLAVVPVFFLDPGQCRIQFAQQVGPLLRQREEVVAGPDPADRRRAA